MFLHWYVCVLAKNCFYQEYHVGRRSAFKQIHLTGQDLAGLCLRTCCPLNIPELEEKVFVLKEKFVMDNSFDITESVTEINAL
jgi:hypothetical protein